MRNMLGSLLLSLLILLSALPQQTKTVKQNLTQLGGWLETWNARTFAHQEEQEATLKEVLAAAGGVRAQLEKLLVDIAELVNVKSRQHLLKLENTDGIKGRLAIATILSFTQLVKVVGCFIVIGVLYIKMCVRLQQERLQQEELELMESRLTSKKAKRRSAAARAKDSSSPPAPTQW